jgi:hypothetical protein
VDAAFLTLKTTLMSPPLLRLLNCSKRFIVDCDASGTCFGTVVHQGDGAVAYFSRHVAAHCAKLPAYERELIGLVKVVCNWLPYLWGWTFTVRTYHRSLKFILNQCLTTIPQQQWVTKLFGYDLVVEYRPGKQNVAADALSHRDEEQLTIHALSITRFDVRRSSSGIDCSSLRTRVARPIGCWNYT